MCNRPAIEGRGPAIAGSKVYTKVNTGIAGMLTVGVGFQRVRIAGQDAADTLQFYFVGYAGCSVQ